MTFTAANGNPPPAVQGFTLVVNPGSAPTITSAATVTFAVGVAGSFTVTTAGSPAPSIVRTGSALPAGVTFIDNGNGTGTLSGTPAAGTNGSYAITFTAANGNPPPAIQSFTLVVGCRGTLGHHQPGDRPDRPDRLLADPLLRGLRHGGHRLRDR